ncbi:MAG: DNA-processing protein DprA [Pseudomonadota bacterium]
MSAPPRNVDPQHWLRLLYARAMSPLELDALRNTVGGLPELCALSMPALIELGISEAAAKRLASPDNAQLECDLAWLERDGRTLLTCDDPAFPSLLRRLPDAPVALYAVGDTSILALPQFAMVGSRNPTPTGRDTAVAFSTHLARVGLSIVSGLATGIDAAAHEGALAAGGHTVAVCGTGLDIIYPARHRDLAIRIARDGLLLSEYPVGSPARAHHFPQRNRLISGISVGTLVVEAARKSGSLITAQRAVEQGRDVFAIPGSIHNPLARGCHQLLREGAKLVESAEDILSELAPLVQAHVAPEDPAEQGVLTPDDKPSEIENDPDYTRLLNALDHDPVSVDKLIERTALTADAVSSMLLILELEGRISPVSGGRYVLKCGGTSSS